MQMSRVKLQPKCKADRTTTVCIGKGSSNA